VSRNAPINTTKQILLSLLACILPVCRAAEAPFSRLPSPGAPRARVVIVQDDNATEAFKPDLEKVIALVHRGITNFAGRPDVGAAWRKLVSTQDVVGIKVLSATGNQIGTRPFVVAGVVEGLLKANVPTNHIIIWDRRLSDLRRAGFVELAERYRRASWPEASTQAGTRKPFTMHRCSGNSSMEISNFRKRAKASGENPS
jgi:hypothetical protein